MGWLIKNLNPTRTTWGLPLSATFSNSWADEGSWPSSALPGLSYTSFTADSDEFVSPNLLRLFLKKHLLRFI